ARARGAAARGGSGRSAALKLALRIAVSAGLLVVLVLKIPADSIEPKDDHLGTLPFLVVAISLTFVGFVLSAWRWHRVLPVFDTYVPLLSLPLYYLTVQFVGAVLPSTIGGAVLP